MVAAYSYMALVPIVQPPVIKLITTRKERLIRMSYHPESVSQRTNILFPIFVTVGVIGTGRIGRMVLRNLTGFGCRLIAYALFPFSIFLVAHVPKLLPRGIRQGQKYRFLRAEITAICVSSAIRPPPRPGIVNTDQVDFIVGKQITAPLQRSCRALLFCVSGWPAGS